MSWTKLEKGWIVTNKEKQEFVETAVAFSNGKGGAILIGVDDKARIVGYNQEKIEEAIINMIKSRCYPFIEPDIKLIQIDDKPYVLMDKGVYVRSGSTDRIANRIELDEFYNKEKHNIFGI